MPEHIEKHAAADRKLTGGENQFNLHGLFSLTAAFAMWLLLLPDFRREPTAVAIFWGLAIVAGVCGHLTYTYLLPWRGTVVTSLPVLSAAVLTAVSAFFGAAEDVIDFLLMPIDLFAHQRWSDRISFTIPVFACVAILTAAHPIKPGLVNAIITAIGISLWYGLALLYAAHAG